MQVLSVEETSPQLPSIFNSSGTSHLAELTNEESVDDRLQSQDTASIYSESSSSSNDTLKIRNSLSQLSTDDPDDSASSTSARSSGTLIGRFP